MYTFIVISGLVLMYLAWHIACSIATIAEELEAVRNIFEDDRIPEELEDDYENDVPPTKKSEARR